jgi:NADPH:quinone reductase-like Zn-dependent oxidoreductase
MDPIVRAGFAKDWMEHRFPLTPGFDYAGTVEAVGPGVAEFESGDEVFGNVGKSFMGEGTFAEYVAASSRLSVIRPVGVSPVDAAALPVAGGSALAALDAIGASESDAIAVLGAAGGVGSFATRMAADRGLRVIAATRSGNEDYVRGLGASDVIDSDADDPVAELQRLAPGGLVGIVDTYHDAQGLLPFIATVRPGGTIAAMAAMGVDQVFAEQPVRAVPVRAATDRVSELAELAAEGKLRVNTEAMPLDRAAEALDRLMAKRVRGKLVLAIADAD